MSPITKSKIRVIVVSGIVLIVNVGIALATKK